MINDIIFWWLLALVLGFSLERIVEFIIAFIKAVRKYDPVYSCEVHKEHGCAHVDGYLCDMTDCNILKDYRSGKVIK